ncbi:MAG TPA: FHA domain-containing protein [Gemmatimonadaceae bacterium]
MNASDLIVIVGVPAVVIAAAVGFGVVLPRMRRARQREMGITLAAFSDASVIAPPRPSRTTVATPETAPPQAAPAVPQSPYAPPRREAATGTTGATTWAEPVVAPETPRLRLETAATAERPPRRAPKAPALDGTLQFLAGRLEVIEGREIGQEIRFVRQPGTEKTEVTFGRQDGTPYRHVQLHEPTVSRMHAMMSLEDKNWRLTNLSSTNPASVNGKPLDPDHGSVVLRDGDRVEMGEVVFRFRAK